MALTRTPVWANFDFNPQASVGCVLLSTPCGGLSGAFGGSRLAHIPSKVPSDDGVKAIGCLRRFLWGINGPS